MTTTFLDLAKEIVTGPESRFAKYHQQLTDEQRARLAADHELLERFEAGLVPFLPKFSGGVCWSGMQTEHWVPVEAVFGNAERALRFARRDA